MDVGELNILRAVIRRSGGLEDNAALTPQTRLNEDLEFDSLDCAELALNLEECFDAAVPDEEAHRWRTVGDVAESVERAIRARKGVTA